MRRTARIIFAICVLLPGLRVDAALAGAGSAGDRTPLPHDGPSLWGCNEALANHDGSFETPYAWPAGATEGPDGGAFAEMFSGDFKLCTVELTLSQIGNQTDQTLDLFVWRDDHTGNPGELIAHIQDLDPGPIALWPEVSVHDFHLNLRIDGDWWVGVWSDWSNSGAGWYLMADEDGAGGNSRTKIVPGQGYPVGWEHPRVVPTWSECRSLGIAVTGSSVPVQPLPSLCGGEVIMNHDGDFENAYTWSGSANAPPLGGAFAERFEADVDVCALEFHLTQIGNQSGQTMDVFVWEDDPTGNPGEAIAVVENWNPGPIARWPEISVHAIPMNIDLTGRWWAGFRGNWDDGEPGWLIAVDENGPGGRPLTRIAPGQGYPIGWENPTVVSSWSNCRSLGIQVTTMGLPGLEPVLRGNFILNQNRPNPFNPSTTLSFEGREDGGHVLLEVVDVSGRRVATLVDGHFGPGLHEVVWRGRDDNGARLSSGVYLYRLDSAGVRQTRKMLLLQ